MSEQELPIRFLARAKLAQMQGGFKPCPLCKYLGMTPQLASDCHEIICPPLPKKPGAKFANKYDPDPDSPLVRAVYTVENVIFICHKCNLEVANSVPKDVMLALKMAQPGFSPERVIPIVKEIASYCKNPGSYVPRSINYLGKTYQIL